MSFIAQYDCALIQGKKGVLKTDEAGYSEIVLGAFDVLNSKKQFYPFTAELKALFEGDSSLMRRINSGSLKGEQDHPPFLPGMSVDQYLARWKHIEQSNVCTHIKSVRLAYEKDDKGKNIVLCYGMVKGSGPHAASVDRSLANREENVAYSVRSIVDPVPVRGVLHKRVHTIVTWDQPNEPGISMATKFNTPSMESIDSGDFTRETFELAAKNEPAFIGAESGGLDFAMIRDELGWNKIQLLDLGHSTEW